MPEREPRVPRRPGVTHGTTRERATGTEPPVAGLPAGGDRLPTSLEGRLSAGFGHDLSRVRVHTDAAAAGSAGVLGAAAYTVGWHIVFGRGRFAPGTADGERLLAHEVTHVLQRESPVAAAAPAPTSAPAEVEATRNEDRWARGEPLVVREVATHQVHRQSDDRSAGPPGSAGRVVYLDADIVEEQLKRGNRDVATALRRLMSTAEVRISRWTYYELVERPALPQTKVANRLFIEDLRLKVDANYPPQPLRVDLRLKNEDPKTVMAERDLQLVAAAVASGAEIWSADKVYRKNGNGIRARFGVTIAPETGLPLVQGPKDYRTAREVMGLPAVDILPDGTVRRRDGGPSGGSTPPSGSSGPPGGGHGPSGSGPAAAPTTTTVGAVRPDGTRNAVGTPSPPVAIGGPSARATAGFDAAVLGLQVLNVGLNAVNDEVQRRRVQEAIAARAATYEALRREHPDHWILTRIHYNRPERHPDSPIVPGPSFGHLVIASGVTPAEARISAAERSSLEPPGQETQELWQEPATPAPVARYRTPFPVAGLATFTAASGVGPSPSFQDVSWGGITGFDDEGTTNWLLPHTWTPRFHVLVVPSTLTFLNGRVWESVDIPTVTRAAGSGGDVVVVDLDPVVPGDASAACVFPADDATAELFERAPGTRDASGHLNHYTNFRMVRWVRPDHLTLLR